MAPFVRKDQRSKVCKISFDHFGDQRSKVQPDFDHCIRKDQEQAKNKIKLITA
jgi:hypothetical protein